MNKHNIFIAFFLVIIVLFVHYITSYKTPSLMSQKQENILQPASSTSDAPVLKPTTINQPSVPSSIIKTGIINNATEAYLSLNIKIIFLPNINTRTPIKIDVLRKDDITIASTTKLIDIDNDIETFKFDGIPRALAHSIILYASNYIPTKKILTLQKQYIVELRQKPIIEYYVISETGDPVPGADIKISSNTNGVYLAEVQADETGYAELEIPSIGTYETKVTHPIYNASNIQPINIQFNPNVYKIEMYYNKGSIFGQVTSNVKSVPDKIDILLYKDNRRTLLDKTVTNETGHYEFHNLPFDEYYVTVDQSDQYLQHDIYFSADKKEDALLKRVILSDIYPVSELNIYLENAINIQGVVINELGEALEGALIKAALQGNKDYAIHPTGSPVITDASGQFQLFLNTRIQSWNTIQITAFHPNYNYKQVTIKDFDWVESPSPCTLVLTTSDNQMIGRVIDFHSKKPIPYFIFETAQYAFRYRDDFKIKIKCDESGYFKKTVPIGEYCFFSEENYEIKSPELYKVNEKQSDLELIVDKNEDQKIKLSGVVVSNTPMKPPLHGAVINIISDDKLIASSQTTPEGYFQIDVPTISNYNKYIMSVSHEKHQNFMLPLNIIEDNNNIKIELRKNSGTIQVNLVNAEEYNNITLSLIDLDTGNEIDEIKSIERNNYLISGINPLDGPYCVIATNNNYSGISEVVDLRTYKSHYAEIYINMQLKGNQSDVKFHVIDSNTGKPITVVSCKLTGYVVNQNGYHTNMKYENITDNDGVVIFKNIPNFVGFINLNHSLYKSIKIPFYHNGIRSGLIQYMAMDSNEKFAVQ